MTTTMDEDDERNYIINVRLMKLIGFYQLLNPKTPTKLFGYNVFRLSGTISLLYLVLMIISSVISIYYTVHDSKAVIYYSMLIVITSLALFKLYFILMNANRLWDSMSLTFIDFLHYSGHHKNVLIHARALCEKTSTIIVIIWLLAVSVWPLTPLIIRGNYLTIKSKDERSSYSRYRCNVVNFVFPVTDEYYNNNFIVFFLLETGLGLVYGYVMAIFDFLVISIGITIIYQTKMMALSYSALDRNLGETDLKSKQMFSLVNEESSDLKNLILLIQDHQMLKKKIHELFNVMRPIIFLQLSIESITITLNPFLTVLNLHKGISLTSPDSIKYILATLIIGTHLYGTCYIFTIINKYIDSINFALYSCNWTEMSTKVKKLILLAMRVNNTEQLTLKLSTRILVNIELFASVVHTVYKIVSVFINLYK